MSKRTAIRITLTLLGCTLIAVIAGGLYYGAGKEPDEVDHPAAQNYGMIIGVFLIVGLGIVWGRYFGDRKAATHST